MNELRRFVALRDTAGVEKLIESKGLSQEDIMLIFESLDIDYDVDSKIRELRQTTHKENCGDGMSDRWQFFAKNLMGITPLEWENVKRLIDACFDQRVREFERKISLDSDEEIKMAYQRSF